MDEQQMMQDRKERAELRAVRTLVGLTQQDLAAKFGVAIGDVSNWENAKKRHFPVPADVLDYVRRVKRFHDDEVARRADKILDSGASEVTLTYWRSQPIYERSGMPGYFSVENGISIAVASIVEYEGVRVEWEYPPVPVNPEQQG